MNLILYCQGIKLYFTCQSCRNSENKVIFSPFRNDRGIWGQIGWRFKAIFTHLRILQLVHTIRSHRNTDAPV